MRIAGFGFGLPYGVFAASGAPLCDVTLVPPVAAPGVAPFIEPFMDPFAHSLLTRLASGALDGFDALVFLRESPGAVHAFHYACEFRTMGLLPARAPQLVLCNLVLAQDAAAAGFNSAELARVLDLLGVSPPVAAPDFDAVVMAQADGAIRGAEAFEQRAALAQGMPRALVPCRAQGPRLALLGAPFGSAGLHGVLDGIGALVLDQQGLCEAFAARGADRETALSAVVTNPFAGRQALPLFLPAVADLLKTHHIERVIWQVDPNDDLWGWLRPGVQQVAADAGCDFTDLGFVPRWPGAAELEALRGTLTREGVA